MIEFVVGKFNHLIIHTIRSIRLIWYSWTDWGSYEGWCISYIYIYIYIYYMTILIVSKDKRNNQHKNQNSNLKWTINTTNCFHYMLMFIATLGVLLYLQFYNSSLRNHWLGSANEAETCSLCNHDLIFVYILEWRNKQHYSEWKTNLSYPILVLYTLIQYTTLLTFSSNDLSYQIIQCMWREKRKNNIAFLHSCKPLYFKNVLRP